MLSTTCRGTVRVPRPLQEALPLFTAEGERAWVPGWRPSYPAPTDDTTAPGVVWLTESEHGPVHWLVVDRTADGYRYARTVPGYTSGLVEISARPDGHATVVEVTYRLTALSPDASAYLSAFTAGFDAMLGEWQRLLDAGWARETGQE